MYFVDFNKTPAVVNVQYVVPGPQLSRVVRALDFQRCFPPSHEAPVYSSYAKEEDGSIPVKEFKHF